MLDLKELEMIMTDLRGRYQPRWGRMDIKQKSFKVWGKGRGRGECTYRQERGMVVVDGR